MLGRFVKVMRELSPKNLGPSVTRSSATVLVEQLRISTQSGVAPDSSRKPLEFKATTSEISSVFAAGKKDGPAEKLEPKDAWKQTFELREIETGLASVDKVEVVKGLSAGIEIAVEDPTRPKEKKSNE